IATNSGSTLHVWQLRDDKLIERAKLESHRRPVNCLAFSPKDMMLASCDNDGRVIMWDPAAGKKTREFELPFGTQYIAFAPDNRHIATANENGTISILRLREPPP